MLRVLVGKDDAGVRDVVEQNLVQEGMNTQRVSDGERALENLRSSDIYDLVILNIMPPGSMVFRSVASFGREMRASCTSRFSVIMLTVRKAR